MRKPSPAILIALVALFVALGGPATAAKLINGKKLRNNSVTSAKIRNHTLSAADIRRSTLRSLKRTATDVTSANIVDGTIQLDDMGFSSVTGNQVSDRSLAAVDVAPDSLTGAEIATGTIGAAELAGDSVVTKSIKDGAVTKSKMGKAAVAESEVRDGSLTAKDVGEVTGTFDATKIGTVKTGTCNQQDFGSQPVDVSGAIVLVGAPADDVVATARAVDPATLRLQVCNLSPADISGDGSYPFIAFAP
jgi:hypothetical protein